MVFDFRFVVFVCVSLFSFTLPTSVMAGEALAAYFSAYMPQTHKNSSGVVVVPLWVKPMRLAAVGLDEKKLRMIVNSLTVFSDVSGINVQPAGNGPANIIISFADDIYSEFHDDSDNIYKDFYGKNTKYIKELNYIKENVGNSACYYRYGSYAGIINASYLIVKKSSSDVDVVKCLNLHFMSMLGLEVNNNSKIPSILSGNNIYELSAMDARALRFLSKQNTEGATYRQLLSRAMNEKLSP